MVTYLPVTLKHGVQSCVPWRYFCNVLSEWKKRGGEPWQLIEPIDGFHANQQGQALIAGAIWEAILQTSPAALGQLNPNNADIQKIFGNQGGY